MKPLGVRRKAEGALPTASSRSGPSDLEATKRHRAERIGHSVNAQTQGVRRKAGGVKG
jgi:hypothetical protein